MPLPREGATLVGHRKARAKKMAALGDKPTPILFTLTGCCVRQARSAFGARMPRLETFIHWRMAVVFGEGSRSKAPGQAGKARKNRQSSTRNIQFARFSALRPLTIAAPNIGPSLRQVFTDSIRLILIALVYVWLQV